MRALFALVLLIPMAAEAGPLARHGFRLPAGALHEQRPAERKVTLEPYQPPPAVTHPLSMNIGPFEAEIGGGHHFAHYHLEGTRILGGSLGGSFSGHSAKLELTWKNN